MERVGTSDTAGKAARAAVERCGSNRDTMERSERKESDVCWPLLARTSIFSLNFFAPAKLLAL